MLTASRLRERVTIQRRSAAVDALGQPVASWIDVATVWAAVETISGREAHVAVQMSAQISYRVIVRSSVDIRATDRITWGARVLTVEAVLPHQDRQQHVVLVSEGLRDG